MTQKSTSSSRWRRSPYNSMCRAYSTSVLLGLVLFSAFISPAYAQGSGSAGGASEDTYSMSDLQMLSIVAAAREGPANVADPDEALRQQVALPLSVQNTFNAQESIVGQQIQAAVNPEGIADGDVWIDQPDAESEAHEALVLEESAADTSENRSPVVIPGPASLEVVVEDVIADSIVKPDVVSEVPVIAPAPIDAVAQIARKEEVSAGFSLTGRLLSTLQRLYSTDGRIIDEKSIVDAPLFAHNADGSSAVAGVCRDAYFVVLLYKEREEYEKDPNSYILNRAFPCTGAYRYTLDALPLSLPDGTYQLLIGEQGEVGDWVPITALTEITIHRK